jgi:hypothetical protein
MVKEITGYSLIEQMHDPDLAQFVPRLPPKSVFRRRYFWQPQKESIEYQIVEWNRKACGEFQP